MVRTDIVQKIYSGKKISNKHFLKEYQRYVRKLKKAKSVVERSEINAELMLLAKLMDDSDAVRSLRSI